MNIYLTFPYKFIAEGSLEVKLPTIWTDEKQSREEAERREKLEERRVEEKEDADARKGRKVAKHCVFPMICGSGGSKSRLAKGAGAEPAGQMRDEKLHAVVARSTFFFSVAADLALIVFFRPTPLGFRQVVQHVRLHVAEISELIN